MWSCSYFGACSLLYQSSTKGHQKACCLCFSQYCVLFIYLRVCAHVHAHTQYAIHSDIKQMVKWIWSSILTLLFFISSEFRVINSFWFFWDFPTFSNANLTFSGSTSVLYKLSWCDLFQAQWLIDRSAMTLSQICIIGNAIELRFLLFFHRGKKNHVLNSIRKLYFMV